MKKRELEAPDQPYCCIFHPRIPSIQNYAVKDTVTNEFLKYGLCPNCVRRLKREDSFKRAISDRIEELLEKQKKKEEEKCNRHLTVAQ